MIKATAGGGGKGMRAVWKEDGFLDLWESAKQEAKPLLEMTECIWRSLLKTQDT